MIRVSPASAEDLIAIRALLERSGLPTSDLGAARPEFVVIRESGQVIAAGALQRFGSAALLRSVVVAADRRARGFGQAIVSELERLARAAAISRLILLTQTAADFFAHQGYRPIERSSAPQDMQGSEEFRSLCPSSASCMAKNLIPVTVYHNPECGTSRNTLALIRNAGVEPTVIEYLKTPPDRATLVDLLKRMQIRPRQLLREKGTLYGELGLAADHWSDDQLIDQMLAHPILINRPIVVTPWGVKLCRPSEIVREILPLPQRGAFSKEDGERVVNEQGQWVR